MSDLTIQNANTLKEALRKPINLFLGAGFSVLGRNAAGKFLPTGNQLRDDLVGAFRRPELKDLPLAKVCTIIEATRTDLLERYLREVFSVASFDPAYSIIPKLKLAAIFTTNIDNLMPLVFKDDDECYLNDIVKTGPAFANKTAVTLFRCTAASYIQRASHLTRSRSRRRFPVTRIGGTSLLSDFKNRQPSFAVTASRTQECWRRLIPLRSRAAHDRTSGC